MSFRVMKKLQLPSQTNKKTTFLRVNSAHCNALKKFFKEKIELVKVDFFELIFLQKTNFF
jgi:hypothetical protein